MNVVVLRGRLARPAQERLLPSGDRLIAYEVTVPGGPDRRTETVPVVWFDGPASAASLDADDQVVVVGRVRRRFFGAAGVTQSRTEVVAETVLPVGQAKRVSAAVRGAITRMEEGAAVGRD